MHIILGGTGHVGSAVARTLLDHNQPVTIISRDPKKVDAWQRRGATVAIADVHDTDALRAVFQTGTRLFLLNPPAAPSTDTVAEERKSLTAILNALDGSGIRKVVAESTYGAQPGEGVGDLGVLYEMEQELAGKDLSVSIIRAAYYMSNWDMALATARQEGVVHTLYPMDLRLPMVSPDDIGQLAARLLMEPMDKTGLYYVEGPAPYSSADVGEAFADALNKSVVALETPQEQWVSVLISMGFSLKGAESMAAMTEVTLKKEYKSPDSPVRGHTTLQSYINQLVRKQP
ncbi:NmrA family NAD(P)-binding protein [Spirosoma arcticum]